MKSLVFDLRDVESVAMSRSWYEGRNQKPLLRNLTPSLEHFVGGGF